MKKKILKIIQKLESEVADNNEQLEREGDEELDMCMAREVEGENSGYNHSITLLKKLIK